MDCLFFGGKVRGSVPVVSRVPPQPSDTVVFPDDVIVEILSLLNVKSLMRLKCVCKSWYRPDERQLRSWQFTFGYDNSTNTYKIVAFRDNKVRIFNVGEDNVWRNIRSFPVVPLDNSGWHHLATSCGVYVSGAINWVAILSESDSFGYEYGVEDSWTPLLKFSYKSPSIDDDLTWFPLGLSENDDILILTAPRRLDYMPAFLYNIRDNRVEQKTRITNPMKWYLARYYVESLVSPS